ncbi:hypothetical protein EU528_05785 [Candidatus Thorarchaeota archaeon]|nr:MAG: hypothetical protein EU528_05785 [Candidatus Thorarchaeota archaeon]
MAKKKKAAKPTLSPAMFKITGADVKLKIDSKKKKLYYYGTKITPDKAEKVAGADGAEVLGVASDALKISKPKIKYDFYCMYDADLDLKFLRVRDQEIGVNEQVKGTMVGKDIIAPKKKGDFHSISVDIIELFEIQRKDGMLLDGKTGGPARALEKLVKGPGKKSATPAWINKNSISSGKYNSVEKVVAAVAKLADQKPSDAKRVTTHSLTFRKLEGYYIPVYYVKLTAGAKTQTLKINAVDGSVSVDV